MSKAEELINATELVKKMLEHYPEARNSDDDLYLLVCRAINIEIFHLPFGLVMRQRKKYKLPAFETVRRTRQKIQAAHPELWPAPMSRLCEISMKGLLEIMPGRLRYDREREIQIIFRGKSKRDYC